MSAQLGLGTLFLLALPPGAAGPAGAEELGTSMAWSPFTGPKKPFCKTSLKNNPCAMPRETEYCPPQGAKAKKMSQGCKNNMQVMEQCHHAVAPVAGFNMLHCRLLAVPNIFSFMCFASW